MADALSLADRMRAQIAEAQGPDNRWYAGKACGHPPTDAEAILHYGHHGGPEDFARREQEGKITKPEAG